MLVIAMAGLAVNLIAARVLYSSAGESLNAVSYTHLTPPTSDLV